LLIIFSVLCLIINNSINKSFPVSIYFPMVSTVSQALSETITWIIRFSTIFCYRSFYHPHQQKNYFPSVHLSYSLLSLYIHHKLSAHFIVYPPQLKWILQPTLLPSRWNYFVTPWCSPYETVVCCYTFLLCRVCTCDPANINYGRKQSLKSRDINIFFYLPSLQKLSLWMKMLRAFTRGLSYSNIIPSSPCLV
jgi:hypothetical protein